MDFVLKVTSCLIAVFLVSFVTGDFGYSKREQHMWSQQYKSCAGKLQSPIPILSSKSVALPLPAIEMIGYHNLLPRPLSLENDGHTVALRFAGHVERRHIPHIFGAVFKPNQIYEMNNVHFHWGAKNDRGSEHTLNNIRYPMEMHIVHSNIAYGNLSNALNYPDGVAVFGIFFQLQEADNELLSPLLDEFSRVQWANNKVNLNISITLAQLMPRNTDIYYTYKGSLTTPPCSEAVTWFVFPSPVPISFRQMGKFRTLSNGKGILADNYRRLQDVGRRKVYVRKLHPSLTLKFNVTRFNVTNLSWFWQ